MSRLESLVQTPSWTRSRASASPSPGPGAGPSPSRKTETTHHRMLKLVLAEVRKVLKTWDELVIVDGFKACKGCIDEATEMEPERPEVTPHLTALYTHREALQSTLKKLDNNLYKLTALADQADKVLFAAYHRENHDFVFVEPLWLSWTLETFVNSLSPLISAHTAHLSSLNSIANTITDLDTSFDDAKLALEHWRDLALVGERWDAAREWETLIGLELAGGKGDDEMDDGREEEDDMAVSVTASGQKGKKKGRR
ncbi:hypothetical protein I316_05061 [Kwoniella heveanensis BCC8398]|uniref:Uncharacterized protein n=1 Tax=Kwoniella heveanensis BCC8398 TaxID=1296120 RepID=A0A1B9GQH6_9TREE|nr:hypothetical protein I316_05061 [Kwoniella heveanensis BCC8398]